MKTKERGLTPRQRYEPQRQSPSKPTDQAMLRAMPGREVGVKLQSSGEVTAVFRAMDRFTIKLGDDLVVFKQSIQTVRLTKANHNQR